MELKGCLKKRSVVNEECSLRRDGTVFIVLCYFKQVLKQNQMKAQEHVRNGEDQVDTNTVSQSESNDIVVTQLKPGRRHRRNRSMERVPVIADMDKILSDEEQYQSKGEIKF